eukprot:scaffold83853_cov51-Phaeocystis_antarctica.AAC.3
MSRSVTETPGMSRTLKPCCGGPPYCCMRTAWLRAGVSAGAMPWKLAVTGARSESDMVGRDGIFRERVPTRGGN